MKVSKEKSSVLTFDDVINIQKYWQERDGVGQDAIVHELRLLESGDAEFTKEGLLKIKVKRHKT